MAELRSAVVARPPRCRRAGSSSASARTTSHRRRQGRHIRGFRRRRARAAVAAGRRRSASRAAAVRADRRLGPGRRPDPTPARRCGCTAATTTPTPRWPRPAAASPSIDQSTDPIGVLVVADGANTLTPAAPGGYDPGDADVQARPGRRAGRRRRRRVDPAARRRSWARVAFQVLAGLAEPGTAIGQGALPRRALRGRATSPASGSRDAAARDRRADRHRQVAAGAGRRRAAAAGSAPRSSTPTRCSSTAAWTSAPPSCRSPSAAASRITSSTSSTSPRPRRSPATSRPPRADVEAIAARGAVPVHGRRIDALRPVAARRLVVPGHRSRACGRDGRSGSPRSASARCTPSWPAVDPAAAAVDPAHRRPAHRARAGGGRADRPAVRRVRAAHRRTALGHGDHRIGLGHSDSRRTAGPAHRRDVRPTGWSTRWARCCDRGLRDGSPRRARWATPRCSRPSTPAVRPSDVRDARERPSSAPDATCAVSGRGFAATTASTGCDGAATPDTARDARASRR